MTELRAALSVWSAVGVSVALMAPSMAININPQNGTEQRVDVLTVFFRVVRTPAITQRNVKVAILTECQRRPVMVPEGLFDCHQHFFR